MVAGAGSRAGAGMRHTFMERLAHELAASEVATFRYQFPYMEQHRGRPDPPAVLTATVRAAIATAADAAPDLPLLAGGKSLGGRMTSHALSEPPPTGMADATRRVRGLIFFGFPLHPPGRPGTQRAEHLDRVEVPMLFLQGTRDTLADLALLRPLCAKLTPRATLHIVDTADHSFHVLNAPEPQTLTYSAILREPPLRGRIPLAEAAEGRDQAVPLTNLRALNVRKPSRRLGYLRPKAVDVSFWILPV